MDGITASFAFIVLMLVSAGLKATNGIGLMFVGIVLEITAYIQLAYFADLWPFYVMAGLTVMLWFTVIIMAAVAARKDALNA